MVDLSRSEKTAKVLEAIPRDRWVSAAEISAETALGSIEVGALIRRNLLNAHVERKFTGSSWCRRYLYRRLSRLDKEQELTFKR